jgi:hypothetical protein
LFQIHLQFVEKMALIHHPTMTKCSYKGQNHTMKKVVLRFLFLSLLCEPIMSQALSLEDLHACKQAIYNADTNNDGRIVSREFVDLLEEVTPYQNCPETSSWEFISSTGPYNTAFESLSCLCQGYDNSTCCDDKHLVVPNVYPEMYTYQLCMRLYALIETNCYASTYKDPSLSSYPSIPTQAPTYQLFAYSPDMNDPNELGYLPSMDRGIDSDSSEEDKKKLLYIALPVSACVAIALLATLIYMHRVNRSKTYNKEDSNADNSGDETDGTFSSNSHTVPHLATRVNDILPPLENFSNDEEQASSLNRCTQGETTRPQKHSAYNSSIEEKTEDHEEATDGGKRSSFRKYEYL